MSRYDLGLIVLAFAVLLGTPTTSVAQEQNEQQEQSADEGWITVRPGDTLFSIARRHEVSIQDLRSWNNLSGNAIRAGMRLRISPPVSIPVEVVEASSSEESDIEDADPVESDSPISQDPDQKIQAEAGTVTPLGGGMVAVTIGAGETLFSLANQFALSADSLVALNPGLPAALEAGMVVIVPDDRVARTRTVKPGDTLFQIAREEGVSVNQLRELNGISGSSLRVGQELTVPSASVASSQTINLPEAGTFAVRPYPEALDGRTLSTGRSYQSDAFLVGHPSLPPGSIVLVSTSDGAHAFAEVIETAPARRPSFIEASEKLFETLSLTAGDRVSLYLVR